jgi:rhamnose utilization protein RhaD (predicted bifunctional aldolase and dehydrogenase)/NAD(P)-dependent dehydrogenase (short-subunit alcohol dehydrogenase family)
MQSKWNKSEAAKCQGDLELRAYTSRLLGQDENLVLHGGGNTSVKSIQKNIFGEDEEILYIKGSGYDLKVIPAEGFSPTKLDTVKRLGSLESMSDFDMVRELKASMTNTSAPNPSIETILHGLIPFKFVDHTHADSVVTITNTPEGEEKIRAIFGDSVVILPYTMPGFILAKQVYQGTLNVDWKKIKAVVLLGHGVFTFADTAKESYENMIEVVTQAESFLQKHGAWIEGAKAESQFSRDDALTLASLRKKASDIFGRPLCLQLNASELATGYCNLENRKDFAFQGPLTPDHVIQTKRIPMEMGERPLESLDQYVQAFKNEFEENKTPGLECLDPVPRFALWKDRGILSLGTNLKRANIVKDIIEHTSLNIQRAEKLGGWRSLPKKDIFEIEYWELEQAKLKKAPKPGQFENKVAVVTGGASGIGKAICEELAAQGANVWALDITPNITTTFKASNIVGAICDITNSESIKETLVECAKTFGGVDIVVNNAGTFPASMNIEDLDDKKWQQVIDVNLTGHFKVLREATPYLKEGINASVIFVASKNVPAPGPGASAYSVSKAGITQLARVAALELGAFGINVNVLHPNAIFDTGIWTEEVLNERAKSYGISVEEYKSRNVLKKEVTSKDVASLVRTLASQDFAKTTGAQIAIDGGNERVI